MLPTQQVLDRYDKLWDQAEDFVEAYFAENRSEPDEPDGPVQIHVPDLKELNTAITILKRIQDGRRAIHLDYLKKQAEENDADEHADMDNEEISRMLQRLEGDGSTDEAAEDDADEM